MCFLRLVLPALLGMLCISTGLAQTDLDEGDNPYAREDAFHKERAYPGTRIPGGARVRALRALDRMLLNEAPQNSGKSPRRGVSAATDQWTLIGPQPIGTGSNPFSGRITAVAVDPRNSDVVYAGAAEGGVWKTIDGGASWTPLTDTQASLATGAIVLAGGLSNAANLTIGPAPVVAPTGIVSAAYPVDAAVAPGSIVSVYGTNLAPVVASASAGALPSTLGGAIMQMGGSLAPLYFVSRGQVNIQVPWALAGSTHVVLTHTLGTLSSEPVTVTLTPYAPTLFATNQQGSGQGAILISGTATVAAPAGPIPGAHPARHGDFLEIYGTGLGPLKSSQASGAPAPSDPPAETLLPASVTIGGVPAVVNFAGLTPGTVGLYQVNAKIPDAAPVGDAVPVVVTISGVASNAVTVAIQ